MILYYLCLVEPNDVKCSLIKTQSMGPFNKYVTLKTALFRPLRLNISSNII